jgi:hypothetical protein
MEKNRGGASDQENALTYALDLIQQTCSGEIALVIQDSRLIQLERNERIVLCQGQGICRKPPDWKGIEQQIRSSLGNLQYGKLVVVIKKHEIVRIERTEKKLIRKAEG